MMHKAWCSIEEVPYYLSRSSIKIKGNTAWKINDLNPIWVRLLGQSQLSNPSDLPCFWKASRNTIMPRGILRSKVLYIYFLHQTRQRIQIQQNIRLSVQTGDCFTAFVYNAIWNIFAHIGKKLIKISNITFIFNIPAIHRKLQRNLLYFFHLSKISFIADQVSVMLDLFLLNCSV